MYFIQYLLFCLLIVCSVIILVSSHTAAVVMYMKSRTYNSTCTLYYTNCCTPCWINMLYLHVIVEMQQLLHFTYHPAQNVSKKLYHRVRHPPFSWYKCNNLLHPVLNYSTIFSVGLCTTSRTKIQQYSIPLCTEGFVLRRVQKFNNILSLWKAWSTKVFLHHSQWVEK